MRTEEIRTLDMSGIEQRMAEIRTEMDGENADIDALSAEVDALEARKKELKDIAEKRKALMNRVNDGTAGAVVETAAPQVSDEERSAREFVQSGRMEIRALLSTGTIAKPTRVGGIEGLAAVETGIVDDVNAIALTGNGSWVVAYKTADAAAADVTDGEAIAGTGATFGTVEISPSEWGIYDTISNQVKKMTPLNYQAAITESALNSLRVKACEKIMTALGASALVEAKTVALDADFLRTLVLGYAPITGKGGRVLYINQADLATLGKVRGTNEKRPLYDISFDAESVTSGIITEGGMAVRFRVLPDAQLAAGTQYFGQPKTIDMPMWDNYAIETDESELFSKNLLAIRGIQTAGADLVCYHGMQKITQASA